MNTIAKNNTSIASELVEKLPKNWNFRLLKRDFTVTLGKMLQPVQHNKTETEEYYLRSANLRWEGVDITDVRKMWFAPLEKRKLTLQYGDLLVSEGGDVGRTSFWENELSNCYIQNAINRVRAKKKNSTRYLYYWLYLIKRIGYIDAVVSRITIAHLTAEKLDRIPFIKPPVPVQHRIAAYLDKTCAAIDKTIATKQKQLEILDSLRKSIIHKAVTRGLDDSVELKDSGVEWLGRIPRHWQFRQIKRDFHITLGKMLQPHQKEDKESEEYYLRSANIKWDNADLSDVRKMWFSPTEKKRLKLKYNDLLVSEGGDVGRTSIWKNELLDCFIQNAINRVRTHKKDSTKFLYYWLFLIKHIGYIDAIVSRITIAHLTAEKLEKIYYTRPPVAEQNDIVIFLDKKINEISKIEGIITSQISTLEQYRKSLIHECVTGKRKITEDDVNGQL